MKKLSLVFLAVLLISSLMAGPAFSELSRPSNQAMPIFALKFPVVKSIGRTAGPEQYEHWSGSGQAAEVRTMTYSEEPYTECVSPQPVYVQPACPATPCQSGEQVIEYMEYYQPGQVVIIEYVE